MQSTLVSFRHWLSRIQPVLKWPYLVLLTLTLVAGVTRNISCDGGSYLEIMAGLVLISVWLFMFRLGLSAIAVLLFDLLIIANHAA